MHPWNLPADWEWRTLDQVCEINPRRPQLVRPLEAATSFIPMEAVDEIEGRVVEVRNRPYQEVRSGYTYFEENDVLFAKITPSMQNGKAAIARNLIDGFGFGTTEFHVFRPIKTKANFLPEATLLPEWVFYYIRRNAFRDEAMRHFRGAVGQQRVPENFLKSYPIPIPYSHSPEKSIRIQRQIVARIEALLSEVREMREINHRIIEDTNNLLFSTLGQLFPNPDRSLPEGWRLKTIEEISKNPQYGFTASAKSEQVGPRFLRITDIQNGIVDWNTVPFCECNQREVDRYRLINGDIVFARTGATTGKTFIITSPPEAVFASYLIRLQIERDANPDFVYWYFQSPYYWKQITPRGGAQPNMNAQLLKKVRIPVPENPSVQEKIVAQVISIQNEILQMQKDQTATEKMIVDLEQAILAQAFRGEL